ncbi:MAG: hypothetical protein ABR562_02620 [Thermoplasmatota archaeon]
MTERRALVVPLLLAVLVALPALAAPPPPGKPRDFGGTYDPGSQTVTLTWKGDTTAWTYYAYRGSDLLGKTGETRYTDAPPHDSMWVYFLTESLDGKQFGEPAVAAVAGLDCEIASVATSWNYPYAYVHVHEECLGGIAMDRDVTWQSPSST